MEVCSIVSRAVYVGLSSAGASVPNAIMRRGSFHRNRITLVRRKGGKKDPDFLAGQEPVPYNRITRESSSVC